MWLELLQYFRMSEKREAPCDTLRTNPQSKRSKLAGSWPSFQNLLHNPDDYFGDVMTMVGLGRLEDLHRCRQVCRSWNEMISHMTNRSKRTIQIKAGSVADEITNKWKDGHTPLLPEITTAAYLAHHGLLRSVEDMWLEDVDLASVPTEHLTSLASIVTGSIDVDNVSNCDLSHLLGPARCDGLGIWQSLSSEQTNVLEWAMEHGVETLEIWGDVRMDIEALALYNGLGKCWEVLCDGGTGVIPDIYTTDLKAWAQNINWDVETNENEVLFRRSYQQKWETYFQNNPSTGPYYQ